MTKFIRPDHEYTKQKPGYPKPFDPAYHDDITRQVWQYIKDHKELGLDSGWKGHTFVVTDGEKELARIDYDHDTDSIKVDVKGITKSFPFDNATIEDVLLPIINLVDKKDTGTKAEAAKTIWAVQFDSPETALDEEYYFRDAWGHAVNTAIVGDTVYFEPDDEKAEKAIKEWYGDKVSRVQMTDKIYAVLHPFESKKCERLSDYGYEDIVKEIVGDMEQTFSDEEIYDTTSKYDVKVALAKALRTWAPDLLMNIAEDAMEKLGYFAKDYDAFPSVVQDAVDDALND